MYNNMYFEGFWSSKSKVKEPFMYFSSSCKPIERAVKYMNGSQNFFIKKGREGYEVPED